MNLTSVSEPDPDSCAQTGDRRAVGALTPRFDALPFVSRFLAPLRISRVRVRYGIRGRRSTTRTRERVSTIISPSGELKLTHNCTEPVTVRNRRGLIINRESIMNTISGGSTSTRLPVHHYSFRRGWAALALFALVGLLNPASAHAAIPAGERQVLINLYNSTDGPNWNENTGWLGAGNECNWYGVVCDSPNLHVQQIRMTGNNLRGSLPSLSALTNLMDVFANENQLTGSIPPLVGLPLLVNFLANDNQLSGQIPSLAGLPNLRAFKLSNNQLSGQIPSLTGLANLEVFEVGTNQLTGSIPLLAGLAKLRNFDLYDNQLTGTIPSLAGLNKLEQFWVQNNRLTGSIPLSLTNLTSLFTLDVSNNQLSGVMPNVPAYSFLLPGYSRLCPNAFDPIPNYGWDVATGQTPWYQDCAVLPDPVFSDGFDG